MKVPASGVKREVLAGVVRSTAESWSEYQYALRAYQSKLQQDAAFYELHANLANKDAAKAQAARSAVISFIQSIPTKSELAKKGVRTYFSHQSPTMSTFEPHIVENVPLSNFPTFPIYLFDETLFPTVSTNFHY